MLKDVVSAKWRSRFYLVFALGVLATGALALGFTTAGSAIPMAVLVAERVLLYLGGVGFGFVARANTPSETHEDGQ